jgi:hypothetical protein
MNELRILESVAAGGRTVTEATGPAREPVRLAPVEKRTAKKGSGC